jgi:cyclase
MKRVRIIPILLIQNGGLVKSVKFKHHKYVGDPINAVKIFNEKEVDEIVLLDISATAERRPPNIAQIREIASEAYGGGITRLDEIRELITAGVEKVVLNSSAFANPTLITEGAGWVGSQSIVASIDVKKDWLGKYRVVTQNGGKNTGLDPVAYARQLEQAGAGEIFLNSVDKDGTFEGYDTKLIQEVSGAVGIPVVAVGGAGSPDDFTAAIQHGASAAAAGSLFVFQRPHRAVLISYPGQAELKTRVFEKI